MRGVPQLAILASLSLALATGAAGCKHNSSPDSTNQANGQDQGQASDPSQANNQQDPANANVAPVSNASDNMGEPAGSYASGGQYSSNQQPQYSDNQQQPQYNNQQPQYPQGGESQPYSTNQDQYANNNSGSDYGNYNNYYTPTEYAPQPPPALPEYQQPPCPGPNYIWTPGYWSFDPSQGYFWVPGAWVLAPYQGALWTPGWWGYMGGQYGWHGGYWGRHIGFYGGINYGFGYIGFGYQGGYWNGGNFAYNRYFNNVNPTVVRNVYNYRITNVHITRVSYNGGRGGVNVRPRPAEVAAMHEQHNPPMSTQLQLRNEARSNRQNFAKVSHDHPAMVAVSHPVPADHNVKPPQPVRYQAQNQRRNPMQQHGAPNQRPMQQQRGNPAMAQHQNGPQREFRPMPQGRPEQPQRIGRPQEPPRGPAQTQRQEGGRPNGGRPEPQHMGPRRPVQPNRPEANRQENPQGHPARPAQQRGAERHPQAQHNKQEERRKPEEKRPQ